MGKEDNWTTAQVYRSASGVGSEYLVIEGSMEWPWTRQNRVIYTFEFKRTSDREHG